MSLEVEIARARAESESRIVICVESAIAFGRPRAEAALMRRWSGTIRGDRDRTVADGITRADGIIAVGVGK